MASASLSSSLRVEQLLHAVDQLTPAEQREFQRRFADRHAANGSNVADQASLIETARARLPAAAERRLKKLIARSEREQLSPQELADYQSLAEQAQRIDAARTEALAELARQRGQSIDAVQSQIQRKGRSNGA